MEADPQRRRERPGRGAQVLPKYHVYRPKDTTSPVLVDRSLAVDRLARWAARGPA